MIDETITFGDILRAKREAKGLSQADVSEETQIGRSYISMIEINKVNPSFKTIQKISTQGLKMRLTDFFNIDGASLPFPVLQVVFPASETEKKFKELQIKTYYLAVPVLKDFHCLRSEKIEDFEIMEYIVLYSGHIGKVSDKRLLAVNVHDRICVVDTADLSYVRGQVYLVEYDKRAIVARAKGERTPALQALYEDTIIVLSNQRLRPDILGRVVTVCGQP